jgi:hypothetical protein
VGMNTVISEKHACRFSNMLNISACFGLWIFGGSNHQHKLWKFGDAKCLSPAIQMAELSGAYCGNIFVPLVPHQRWQSELL